MRIQLTGPKNSFVVVSIIAKKLTQVPLVIRMAQADAQAAMTASLLKIKKKPTFANHGYIHTGSVMSQTPKAGVYVKEKTKATITVSTGPARSYDLLPGEASALASDVIVDYDIDDKVAPSEIETIDPSGVKVARTKLLIAFTPDATVGQINTLLTSINGHITAMLKGVNQVMVRLSPAPANLSELDTLINTYLTGNRIVRYVEKATMPVMASLPPPIDTSSIYFDNITHQLDVRAHAAWNARSLIKSRISPNIIIADGFGNGSPNTDFAVFPIDPDQFTAGNPDPTGHGYHVLGVMAATYGGDNTRGSVTGMYPGSGTNILTLFAVDAQLGYSSIDIRQKLIEFLTDMGSGYHVGVILNTSLGYLCPSGDYLDKTCIEPGALAWLEQLRGPALFPTGNTGPASLENMFLHVTAAGNTRDPGDTDAVMNSEWTAARLHPNLVVPGTTTPLTNLTNTLVIENRERSPVLLGGTPGCRAADSKFPGNLSAIGQNVFSLTGNCEFCYDWANGTSQATGQVAGLAAYMWTIKPGLTPQSIMDILMRTADAADCGGTNGRPVVDAYAAVLALDRNYPDMEVRRAILDLNEDRLFDETDVEKFLAEFDTANGAKDYSRYDLNGDGLTGGTETRPFNLNMNYPPTYTSVSQTIEGNSVSFDENSLTDLDILCYYAYSPLYTGDTDKRKDLLKEKCGKEPSVDVTWVSLTDLAMKQTSSGDELICNQNQFLGDSTSDTPLPLPISLFVSCPPYNDSTATFEQVSPGHLTVAFSGSATKVRIPVPPPDPWGYYVVFADASTQAYGVIPTAGTYTVDFTPQLTYNPTPPSNDQTFELHFYVFFVGGGEDSLSCKSIAYPDNPYSRCCHNAASGTTCGPVGNLSYDVDVPEQGMNYWAISVGMAPGKWWWHVPPEDISISGQLLSIKPKK